MFGVLALMPASQTRSTGLPWWLWLLLLVMVLLFFIWWQGRSEAKKAPPVEVTTPAPVSTVQEPPSPGATAAAPADAAEGPGVATGTTDKANSEAAVLEPPA